MDSARQDLLFAHFTTVCDGLVNGVDIADLADQLMRGCVDLLDVSAAGILLDDPRGAMGVLACSSGDAKELELLELQSREGPCYVAFSTGEEIVIDDLEVMAEEWPVFLPAARAQGVRAAAGVPLTVGGHTVGALNLFRASRAPFVERDLQVARLLCSAASIGIMHQRRLQDEQEVRTQLQSALDSRVSIEQAKGIIAARAGVGVTTAFEILRSAARGARRSLTEIATEVVSGQLPTAALVDEPNHDRRDRPGGAR